MVALLVCVRNASVTLSNLRKKLFRNCIAGQLLDRNRVRSETVIVERYLIGDSRNRIEELEDIRSAGAAVPSSIGAENDSSTHSAFLYSLAGSVASGLRFYRACGEPGHQNILLLVRRHIGR